jgi:hypothetical protein
VLKKAGNLTPFCYCKPGVNATAVPIVSFYFDSRNLMLVMVFIPIIQFLKKWVLSLPKRGSGMDKKMEVINTQFWQ